MKFSNYTLDKSAITLSSLCLAHCLVLPVMTVIFPSLIASVVNQEIFHIVMVFCVLPISIFALTMGCKKHNKLSIAIYGGLGLAALIAALVFSESHLGEAGEKIITTIGTLMIAFAHIQNYKLCKKSESCAC